MFRDYAPRFPGDENDGNKHGGKGKDSEPNVGASGFPRYGSEDGQPLLLPPFRPSTPEAEVNYHVSRVRKREDAIRAAIAAKRIAAVRGSSGTLFAEIIQEDLPHGNVWARPLMLLDGANEWIDLRQTSDCLLPGALLEDSVTSETRTTLKLNLLAAEKALCERFLNVDTGDMQKHRNILSAFLQTLSDQQ
jgi:hypothetical protein